MIRRAWQYIKHWLHLCEGTGMVCGRECYLCYHSTLTDRRFCTACHGKGWFKSGACHCGESMKTHTVWDHTPVEMEGDCPYCEVKE